MLETSIKPFLLFSHRHFTITQQHASSNKYEFHKKMLTWTVKRLKMLSECIVKPPSFPSADE